MRSWQEKYFDALDIVNNWRSSHNFPLNTFHVWLKRRAKLIDPGCITAQRIKRLSSIEAKLERFSTMTLSQIIARQAAPPTIARHETGNVWARNFFQQIAPGRARNR